MRVLQSDTSINCNSSLHTTVMVICGVTCCTVGMVLPMYAAVRIVVLERYGQLYASNAGLLFQSLYESYRRMGKHGVLRELAPVAEVVSMFVRAIAVLMLVLQSSNETAQAGVCMAVTLAWLVAQGTVPIPGTRNSVRLEENLGSLALRLRAEDSSRHDDVGQAAGDRYPGGRNPDWVSPPLPA